MNTVGFNFISHAVGAGPRLKSSLPVCYGTTGTGIRLCARHGVRARPSGQEILSPGPGPMPCDSDRVSSCVAVSFSEPPAIMINHRARVRTPAAAATRDLGGVGGGGVAAAAAAHGGRDEQKVNTSPCSDLPLRGDIIKFKLSLPAAPTRTRQASLGTAVAAAGC